MEFTTTPEAKVSSSYLSQAVNYGGEHMTRGEMIIELNRVAASRTKDGVEQQRLIDMYLIGAESVCDCDATVSCASCV